jgi:acyl-[acyl-carrier-protein] desaturase
MVIPRRRPLTTACPDEQLRDLSDEVERLLDVHGGRARPWYPSDFVAELDERGEVDGLWSEEGGAIARSALWVNLLTEDNLAHYYSVAFHLFAGVDAWLTWFRLWLAEEGRHSIAIRAYVSSSGALDAHQLDDARFAQACIGWQPPEGFTPLDLTVYAAIQELATRISHSHTARVLPDGLGQAILRQVAADENRHHLFYRDIVATALQRWPEATLDAISRQVRSFQMPGSLMPGFREHSHLMAEAGIYNLEIHCEQVLAPLLLSHWKLGELEGLDARAEDLRDQVLRTVDRRRRAARLAASRRPGASQQAPATDHRPEEGP